MATPVKRVTINDIREMKQNGEKNCRAYRIRLLHRQNYR